GRWAVRHDLQAAGVARSRPAVAGAHGLPYRGAMAHREEPSHHREDASAVRCLVIVVSDTRSLDTDEGGKLIAERLTAAGHSVAGREVLADALHALRRRVLGLAEEGEVDAVLVTGGTGLGPRDVTPEAIEPLLTRAIP